MSEPVFFTWAGIDYRSSESFHHFDAIRLPDGTILFCDGIDGSNEPINLREPTGGDDPTTGDRATAFEVTP